MEEKDPTNPQFSNFLHNLRSKLSIPLGVLEDLRDGHQVSKEEISAGVQSVEAILFEIKKQEAFIK